MLIPSSRIGARAGGRMEILLCAALMVATLGSLGWVAYATL